jgi:hypothetical protein
MARVDPELEKDLAGDPARRIEVIVTASTDLKDLMAALGNDVRVTHVYRLIRGVAATASAASIRRLAANQARDRVAIDAVGVAILRMFGTTPDVSRGPVFQAEQLARAADLGLGVRSPDLIHIAVDDASSEAYAARVREALVA